jgi:uncharacterized protein YdgA (DUF945 family)
MEINTLNSLTSVVLLATISTSVISLTYEFEKSIPKMNYDFKHQNDIADWKDIALRQSDYQFQDESIEKLQIIIDFSNKVIQNTKDIDSEFVDIVNKNFWELI